MSRSRWTRYWMMGAALLPLVGLARAETIAIVHAKAWTLTADTALEDATIVIRDGRISSVATGASPPAGARVVDARNQPVTPSLINAATQIGLVEVSAATETVDHTVKPGVPGAPGAGFDVEYAVNANSALIQLARADGLARGVSYPGGSGVPPFSGSAVLLHLLEHGDIVEHPRVAVFAVIGNRSASASYGSRAALWQALRGALDSAKAAATAPPPAATPAPGASSASPASRAAPAAPVPKPPDAQALDLVVSGKVPLAIATNRESDLLQAAQLARDYGIRVVVIGGAEGWMAAQELAAAKIAVVLDPTENLPYSFDQLGSRLDNAALLRKAGVTIAISLGGVQSYNAGSSLREGAGIAVANGLAYVEGLRAITSAPAQIWGVAEHAGTIAPGKDADLVVWNGDPLEPSTLPTAVFIAGRDVSLATHQTLLRDRYLPLVERARGVSAR
jgi:imidazolonepropionase-like amidohydrolase